MPGLLLRSSAEGHVEGPSALGSAALVLVLELDQRMRGVHAFRVSNFYQKKKKKKKRRRLDSISFQARIRPARGPLCTHTCCCRQVLGRRDGLLDDCCLPLCEAGICSAEARKIGQREGT